MFCQACGAQNSEGARFCNMCGSQIAPPGSPGGLVADGTVKAAGGQPAPPAPVAAPAVAPAAPTGPTGTQPGQPAAAPAHHTAPAPTNQPGNVWDQAGASAQPRAYAGGGLSQIGHSTLAGVGVQSSKRAWAIVIGTAVVLVGLGAAAGFMMGGDDGPPPEEYDPDEHVAEIGLPMPEGVDMPEQDIFDDPHGIPVSSMGGSGSSSMGSGGAPATTVGGSGSTAMTGTGSGSGTSTMTGSGSGTTTMTGSGSGSGSGTTSMTGSGSGTTTMTGSGSGSGTTTMTGSGSGSGSSMSGSGSGSGSNTIPADVPEERDIAMSMYSQRVRYVISRYYASRAQSCFDHASRNAPSVSGQVRVSVTIGADGAVTRSAITQNTTGNEALGQCLVSNTRQWRLPPPPDGELTMVLPFRN